MNLTKLHQCPNCGATVYPEDTVCPFCGSPLASEKKETVEQPRQEQKPKKQIKQPTNYVLNPVINKPDWYYDWENKNKNAKKIAIYVLLGSIFFLILSIILLSKNDMFDFSLEYYAYSSRKYHDPTGEVLLLMLSLVSCMISGALAYEFSSKSKLLMYELNGDYILAYTCLHNRVIINNEIVDCDVEDKIVGSGKYRRIEYSKHWYPLSGTDYLLVTFYRTKIEMAICSKETYSKRSSAFDSNEF